MRSAEGAERSSSVVGAAAVYAGEQMTRALMAAGVGVVVARLLGPTDLGTLSFLYATFAILTPLGLLGFMPLLVRDLAVRQDDTLVAIATLAQIVATTMAAMLGIGFIAVVRPDEGHTVWMAAAMAPMVVAMAAAPSRAVLETSGRARAAARASLIGTAIAGAARLGAVITDQSLVLIAATYALEPGVGGVLLVRAARGAGVSLSAGFAARSRRRLWDLLREGWPYLVTGLAAMAYLRVDQAMVALLAGDREAGFYGAAVRLSETWYLLPTALAAAVRPRLARAFAVARLDDYRQLLKNFIALSALGGFLVSGFMMLIAGPAVQVLYGAVYEPSAPVLRMHVLALPFVFVGIAADQWFIDRRMQHYLMWRAIAGAGVNVALNMLLIPSLGAAGAAIATILSYAVVHVAVNVTLPIGREVGLLQLRGLTLRGVSTAIRELRAGIGASAGSPATDEPGEPRAPDAGGPSGRGDR